MPLKDIFRPSTRVFFREARRVKGNSFFNLLHGYVYGRWTYFYIAVGSGRHPLSKRLAPLLNWIGERIVANGAGQGGAPAVGMEDTYHGKVVPLAAARQLVSVKEDITLGDLEHVIPYSLARDIVLQNPDHIVVLDCPCRVASEHPCLPLDVCLIVGEPFASFVTDHHPQRSRRITPQEAAGYSPGRGPARARASRLLQRRHAGPLLCDLQLLRLLLWGHAGPARRHADAGLFRLRGPGGR